MNTEKMARYEKVVEAAKDADRRCLRAHSLPGNNPCLDIQRWDNHRDYYCRNCRLTAALSELEQSENLEEGREK